MDLLVDQEDTANAIFSGDNDDYILQQLLQQFLILVFSVRLPQGRYGRTTRCQARCQAREKHVKIGVFSSDNGVVCVYLVPLVHYSRARRESRRKRKSAGQCR